MNDVEQRKAAKKFADFWLDKGYEKGESQKFWLQLLGEVLGLEHPAQFITFENQVMLDHTSFIDGYIDATKVLIEQKSLHKDLRKPIKQSDGSLLTPFQQAKRYSAELPFSRRPRWIVISNFAEFHIYDMEKPFGDPEILLLKDLPKEYYRLQFLVNRDDEHTKKEMQVSMDAGKIVGTLYEALLKQYKDATNEESLKSLNMLCVRLVFCFYAEDAAIFGGKDMFHDYLQRFESRDLRRALIDLFKVLDTKEEERDPYLDDELAAFPYVNGGLFADEDIEIPQLTDEIRDLLLVNASENFDWSGISPTIFGAVFESTLNPETRRHGGMHYTSIENIHKVIDSLFLDELQEEFAKIKEIAAKKKQKKALEALQKKLAQLTFLDPACGSGNFLTETYISLRKLENEILKLLLGQQIIMGDILNPVKVSIKQFYGIEINDFAVSVAKTALWIAESQMLKETEDIIARDIDFLPLKTNAYIHEGNALRVEWEEIVPKDKLNYIMGNPPFVGFTYMDESQKNDMATLFPETKNLDYVCCWYKKAIRLMKDTKIQGAFVSTNSITQGETVYRFWDCVKFKINFAHQTFIWDSEALGKAHVHCVIIGFSLIDLENKWLFSDNSSKRVKNINAYLNEGPNIIIRSRNKPLCNVSKMVYGNKPADGKNLIIEDVEYADFIKQEPEAKKYIKPLLGAVEYLHNKKRWCLWLKGVEPSVINKMPKVYERIMQCRDARASSKAAGIRKFADTPTVFAQITQPEQGDYILIPRVSSERRKYVPMGFCSSEIKVTDAVQIVPEASMYELGILTSNVHMAWMRAVAGRLKSDYRYSKDIVYNNFPWPTSTDAQKAKIEKTAQAILDARALYPESSLADLYDELTMPIELRNAHRANDKAVMEAYGFWGKLNSEAACVAELMKMYQQLVSKETK